MRRTRRLWLTSNATALRLCCTPGLRRYAPLREIVNRRELFVTDEIAEYLAGGRAQADFPTIPASIAAGGFLAGHLVSVSRTNTLGKEADFLRLEDLDEVWRYAIVKKPRPGWRILGRFAAKDVFVGLTIASRIDLGSRRAYEAVAGEAINEWNRLLPGVQPLSGLSSSDYVGEVFRDVDAT